MKKYALAILLVISQLCSVLSLESTGPAFMWSPHIDMKLEENVNYQTLSSKDLARAVMSKGTWSNIMCKGKSSHQHVDVAVVFVGKELQSSDISGKVIAEASLIHLLKDSFTKSNFSMAYPYVSANVKEGTLENSVLEEFEESCDHKLGVGSIAITDSCSIDDQKVSKLSGMHAVQEFIDLSMEKDTNGLTNLLVICHRGFSSSKNPEGDVFSELMSSLDNSGAKYAVLYVSDPYNPIQNPSNYQIGRFLTEAQSGNASLDSIFLDSIFCDGVCQIKKSLLEALFVTIVLLIILISGLCCMMGIDSPTRFETPQES
ncbi:hypothetical protein RND81_10G119500 [Saponaria officinalis]|uniref:V-type proton ATPase subunit S1/VOA1 transmembrane domain-containing protein n=1 Tax=Saponaria officinalis TaxID=3572 RepID=A0AAW1I224_SAPOF